MPQNHRIPLAEQSVYSSSWSCTFDPWPCSSQVSKAFYKGNGQPVLIGTCDVDESEEISKALESERYIHVTTLQKPHECHQQLFWLCPYACGSCTCVVASYGCRIQRWPVYYTIHALCLLRGAALCDARSRSAADVPSWNGCIAGEPELVPLPCRFPHQVLNARPDQHAQESQVIAQAGMPGAITIATNRAGARQVQ